ncbi:MAG: thermonuclease family protein [Deltaproteobacteria bacterium]|nr:thermonuclease family protein [Deltaproteobacteria bacterium]
MHLQLLWGQQGLQRHVSPVRDDRSQSVPRCHLRSDATPSGACRGGPGDQRVHVRPHQGQRYRRGVDRDPGQDGGGRERGGALDQRHQVGDRLIGGLRPTRGRGLRGGRAQDGPGGERRAPRGAGDLRHQPHQLRRADPGALSGRSDARHRHHPVCHRRRLQAARPRRGELVQHPHRQDLRPGRPGYPRRGQRGLPVTRRVFLALIAVVSVPAFAAGCSREPSSPCGPVEGTVAEVVDGDTLKLASGEKIRLLMVNTPEITMGKNECYGEEAAQFHSSMVLGQAVTLRYDKECEDRYGRLLAYVTANEREVNSLLIERGFGCVMHIAPNGDDRALEFAELEAQAKASKRGVWACDPVPCE